MLETGVRVPADLRLSHTVGLQVDESLLTGESVPVTKQTRTVGVHTPPADRSVHRARRVRRHHRPGSWLRVATGMRTRVGERSPDRSAPSRAPLSPLQLRMRQLARIIGIVIGRGCRRDIRHRHRRRRAGRRHVPLRRRAWRWARSPRVCPIVLTITLAIGVRRMADRRAIVRRLAAVETLGQHHRHRLGQDRHPDREPHDRRVDLGRRPRLAGRRRPTLGGPRPIRRHPLDRTLRCGVLANEAQLYLEADEVRTEGDPTEAALLVAAARLGLEPEAVRDRHDSVAEIPFEAERRYSASVRAADDGRLLVVKGAPERIVDLCDTVLHTDGRVNAPMRPRSTPRPERWPRRDSACSPWPNGPARGRDITTRPDSSSDGGLTFLGMQGMLDPPRAGVIDAVAGCRDAGHPPGHDHRRPRDHRAGHRDAHRDHGRGSRRRSPARRWTGWTTVSCAIVWGSVSVYARVSPEHKLRIVHALRHGGDVVAVTGDGVNDAPALKAADIGIAMGKSGTDVARDAADLVLADDNFASIYAAVHEGRATFDNVRKATYFLLSTGAAEILALVIALSLRWPLLLLPTQILWLNLVTNGVQDVALGFEPAEPGIVARPPRPPREGVMSSLLWKRTLLMSAVMAAGMLVMFRWEQDHTGSVEEARTVALTTMVLFQTFHLGNVRSEQRSAFRISPLSNPFLLVTAVTALTIHAVALYLPVTQYVLHVEPIGLDAWVRAAAISASIIVVGEADKLAEARWRTRRARLAVAVGNTHDEASPRRWLPQAPRGDLLNDRSGSEPRPRGTGRARPAADSRSPAGDP